jgi:ASCH domain
METEQLKRALSIRQPFVELILTGRKTAEYRSRYTHMRERVYLYAGKVVNDVKEYPYDRGAALAAWANRGQCGVCSKYARSRP